MANPNSPLTWVRFQLARWLDPYPDQGEAWCMNCTLNGGRTLILNANGHTDHAHQHRDDAPTSNIAIRANYGYVSTDEEG